MEISCSIIQDLLPGYADGTCRNESKVIVENHLKTCLQCRQLCEKMKNNKSENEKKKVRHLKKKRYIPICFILILLLVLSFFFIPIQGIFANILMYHRLHSIENAGNYTVGSITYYEEDDLSSEFYVMNVIGKGEDDAFKISWEPYHKVEDTFKNIANKKNMISRLISSFQEESDILTKNMLPVGHWVAIGGLWREQTKEYLISHYENNIEYDKFLFKEIPLTFGLHVDDMVSINDAVKEAKLIQDYFDSLGMNIEIYNITFDAPNGRWESFENLKREDLSTSLPSRLTKIRNGKTDEFILYSKN